MKNNRFILFLFIIILCSYFNVANGQKSISQNRKSLVTRSMAEKVANSVKAYNSNLTTYFFSANNIENIIEGEKILYEITKHYDYVEKFIIDIIRIYGIESGWFIFKDIGFTPTEYSISKQIYDNWEVKYTEQKRKEELQKKKLEKLQKEQRKKEEQEKYDNWLNNGIPVLEEEQVSIPATIKANSDIINKQPNLIFPILYDNCIPIEGFYNDQEFKKSVIFNVKIGIDNSITLIDCQNDILRRLFDALEFCVISPAKYSFKELGKTVDVESTMSICLNFSVKVKKQNFKYVRVKRDKKSGLWSSSSWQYKLVENDHLTADLEAMTEYYTMKTTKVFTDKESENLQYVINLQPWAKTGKKRLIGFCFYTITANCDALLDGKNIYITDKIGIIRSVDK